MTEETKPLITKRGKNKIQNPLVLRDSYNYYLEGYKPSSKYHIQWDLYKLIISEFNKRMMDKIIEEGYFFKLPFRLGVIRLRKRKTNLNVLKPDFALYRKTGGKVIASHLNEHTDGYYVRFYWNKNKGVIVKNKTLYSFIVSRQNSRRTAKYIKENPEQMEKYFE